MLTLAVFLAARDGGFSLLQMDFALEALQQALLLHSRWTLVRLGSLICKWGSSFLLHGTV